MTFYSNGVFTVSTADELNQAIADVDAIGTTTNGTLQPGAYTIDITSNVTLGTSAGGTYATADGSAPLSINNSTVGASNQLYAINLRTGVSLTIDGGGNALSGAGTYNGFFVYNGQVAIENLTIENTVATGGASRAGGGGAGLGGGLFVAGPNPIVLGSKTMTAGGNVTLTNVAFSDDAATGGSTSQINNGLGGGGLEGGAGGGVAGGGVGLNAFGASYSKSGGNAGAGLILGAASGGGVPIPPGNNFPNGGAMNPGLWGGGGGGYSFFGGGVVGGDYGNGGFGGGGSWLIGGAGGFGGGGGQGISGGGQGGFGGGGGEGDNGAGRGAGFGGGKGGTYSGSGGGGGGLGAGADVFVQQGGTLTFAGSGTLGAGTVAGGTAIGNGFVGAGLGTSLFLQGDQTVTLAPGAGNSVTVAGTIADETGSAPLLTGNQGTGTGAGALTIGPGTVTLEGANTYTGGTTIAGGTLDDAPTVAGDNALGSGAITFAGTPSLSSTLVLEGNAQPGSGGTFADTLTDFGDNDSLDLHGLAYVGTTPTTITASGTLTVAEGATSESFTLGGTHPNTFYAQSDGSGGTLVSDAPVCFAAGTAIRTPLGDVLIEQFAVGDLVLTTAGEARLIRWLGHRSLDCRACPEPTTAWPIRVAAHAFGENRPLRDLFVSPGHAICVDVLGEVLIPAGALVNGTTVQQVEVDKVNYWHVELDSHDVILAENLACESYLDMGNRGFFLEADIVDLVGGPDPSLRTHADFCRSFIDAGPVVEAVKRQIRRRSIDLGWTLTDALDLHLEVDGQRLDPVVRGLTARFHLPVDAKDVWLVSPTARPCDTMGSGDGRDLGLCVGLLRIGDGFSAPREIAIDDPLLCIGFHAVEEGIRRWTAGRARLPAALWHGCEEGFYLSVDFAGMPVPRWVPAEIANLGAISLAAELRGHVPFDPRKMRVMNDRMRGI